VIPSLNIFGTWLGGFLRILGASRVDSSGFFWLSTEIFISRFLEDSGSVLNGFFPTRSRFFESLISY